MATPQQPQSASALGKDILKDLSNRLASYNQQKQFTADSTQYRKYIQPHIMGSNDKYIPPKQGTSYGDKLVNNNPTGNFQNNIDVIERLKQQPQRPKKYLPKYTW